MPFVVDADGLNAFAGDADALADRKTEAVLTPHLGELARLIGGHDDDRLAAARALAGRADAVALVKGSRTVVAAPDAVRAHQPDRLARARHGRDRGRAHRHDRRAAGSRDCNRSTPRGPARTSRAGGYPRGRDFGEGTLAGDVAEPCPPRSTS